MKLRLAKTCDIKYLASIHFECSINQPGGFMHKLGNPFLWLYYKILLSEKKSIIIVAVDENDYIHGFCSGTLAAEEHIKALKNHKIILAISLIPALIRKPSLYKEIIERNDYLYAQNNFTRFGSQEGPRNEYWAWRPNSNKSLSVHLFKTWLNIVFDFGFNSVKGEVDSVNKPILLLHKLLGVKILEKLDLPDGRSRYFVEYVNPE